MVWYSDTEGGKKKSTNRKKEAKVKKQFGQHNSPGFHWKHWFSKHDAFSPAPSHTSTAGMEGKTLYRVSNKRHVTLWLDSPSKLAVVTWQVPSPRLLERKIRSQGKVSSSLTMTMSPTCRADRRCHEMNLLLGSRFFFSWKASWYRYHCDVCFLEDMWTLM